MGNTDIIHVASLSLEILRLSASKNNSIEQCLYICSFDVIQTHIDTGLENVQAVSPEMVGAGQFGYASETKTAESEEIRHQEQYVSATFCIFMKFKRKI